MYKEDIKRKKQNPKSLIKKSFNYKHKLLGCVKDGHQTVKISEKNQN